MNAIDIIAALIVVSALVLFIPYLRSVWRLPSGHRPLTPECDRLGHPMGEGENPDYTEEEPDEERATAVNDEETNKHGRRGR